MTSDVYAVCVESAKTGDVQSGKLMLELRKQNKQFNKGSQKIQKRRFFIFFSVFKELIVRSLFADAFIDYDVAVEFCVN